MRAMRLRYAAIGLLTYVQSIGMVLTASSSSRSGSSSSDSSRSSSTSSSTAAVAACRSGSGDSTSSGVFNDLPSLVALSHVVFVGNVTKVRKIAVADDLNRYRVRFAVVETVKGQSLLPPFPASTISQRSTADVDVIVSLPRVQRQTGNMVSLCVPVVGSRYIVFAAPSTSPTTSSSSSLPLLLLPATRRGRVPSSSPLTLEASGLPEPFSERALRRAKEFSCPKCVRPPRVSIPSGDVTLITDQRLRLQCRASGQPRPLVTWYKDELPIAADRRMRVTTNSRGSQLQISKVKVEDTGIYSCRGVNVLGRSQPASTSVVVRTIDSSLKPHSTFCDNQSYCMNGGICYVMTALDQQLCECKPNFEGRRCEEKRVGQPVLATGRQCSLATVGRWALSVW